jgi:hypothetical protein
MLMTYEDHTSLPIGTLAERWTRTFLDRLSTYPTASGQTRSLTGHFSFDFIQSTKNGELYPIECNARVHTAVILLPLNEIATCYATDPLREQPLKPMQGTLSRTWWYNDLIMRYLPLLVKSPSRLEQIHPSLPACLVTSAKGTVVMPSEAPLKLRIESTLVPDDWLPFLILWHVWWPYMLITRWWMGKKWTRVSGILMRHIDDNG